MRNVISLVLGGGRGTRLYPLTKFRAKPAVPLAAKYRLIDIPLSNCINSGLNRIYVLTQFMSVSTHRHIRQTYHFDPFSGGFVEVLAAQQTMEIGTDWYQGTADAVRKNLRYLQQPGVDYVLILSGDQLYRMDFRTMVESHREAGADVSIAAMPVTRADASGLGIMKADESGRVIDFVEKPKSDEELDRVHMESTWFSARDVESRGRSCLASMGIYLFNRDLLVDLMTSTTHEDFGKEVFPQSIHDRHVQVHLFDDYWEDIGTIRAFYEANLSLASREPPFQMASAGAPVYSHARYLPPTRIEGATITGSLLADGCQIEDGTIIENSIVGLRCIIGSGVTIKNSILMGVDYYEDQIDSGNIRSVCRPRISIGAGTLIDGAIVDKNCHIGKNVRIVNDKGIVDGPDDNDTCIVRDGIPVVLKGATLPDNWQL